jgi:hypothetical protein
VKSIQIWPALAGIVLAGFGVVDMASGSELATILAASGLVYVGAGACCGHDA